MSLRNQLTIDLAEEFERLPSAPIVEAVIHWQAPAGKSLDQATLREELTRRFPNYDCKRQQGFQAALTGSADAVEFTQRTQWEGFRLIGQGDASRHVVQFRPNGVVFSRLTPYEHWEPFVAEALRFWQAYREIAEPPIVERLGVRFINQITLGTEGQAADFLRNVPAPPPGIGLSAELFFHQDAFRVSGYAYKINWVRTVQPTPGDERVLIVDIDVSSEKIDSIECDALHHDLAEMRFLKNKLFFSSMTEQAVEHFRKDRDE
jgi:uncharacterized protein (TIGR04255 family)